MNRDFYAKDWERISLNVREAANWRCSRCGRQCRKVNESWEEFQKRIGVKFLADVKPQHYLLAAAHLDQNPANNDWENLAALCLLCHWANDRPYLQYNMYANRERRGQLNLFMHWGLVEATLGGHGKDPRRLQLPIPIQPHEPIRLSGHRL